MTDYEKAPPWTDEEIGFLIDSADRPAPEVALALGRTQNAVLKKRSKLRKGWAPQLEHWSADEDELILSTPHLTAEQVAEQVGRSRTAVEGRRVWLRRTRGARFNDLYKNPLHIGGRPLLAKTCTACGKLLASEWYQFGARKNGRSCWATRCRHCCAAGSAERGARRSKPMVEDPQQDRARRRATYARLQQITRDRATRHREEWTEQDHKVLADPDLTPLEKALRLGRTYGATVTACFKNGYPSHRGLGEATDLWRIFNPNEPERGAA